MMATLFVTAAVMRGPIEESQRFLSFRGARRASPESILSIVVMDSGLAPLRYAPRNDGSNLSGSEAQGHDEECPSELDACPRRRLRYVFLGLLESAFQR